MKSQQSKTDLEQLKRQTVDLFVTWMEQAERLEGCSGQSSPENLEAWPHLAQITPQQLPYLQDYIAHLIQLTKQYAMQLQNKNKVAYQGTEGAFSHIALRKLFPHAQAQKYPTWAGVFEAVQTGQAEYGVLPFENSHAGDVSAVLDLCFAHPELSVCRVYDLPVNQNLLALPGTKLSDVRRVLSHPQAIAQSEPFLRCLQLETSECLNTALAAQTVAEQGDKTLAAIASEETARLYGLEVLAKGINSDQDNTTRFIVISKERPAQGNRFSLLFTVDHKAGQLARVIQEIGAAGFNMECIKSRPMPGVRFEYYFYVELEGTVEEYSTQTLLTNLTDICNTLRVLGVYTK